MILIAESGSTKTDQVAFSNNSNRDVKISTAGFNPHILTTSDIGKQLFQSQELKKLVPQVKKIYFYGAGCSSASMKKVVKDAIRTLFPTATIEVNHDLEAAVRGTWDGNPAITSILGTGSNCCYFDGKTITQTKPSLGYLLGDEGSGNNIGGKLYKAIVYGEAKQDLENAFFKEFDFGRSEMVTLLYSKEKPNEFLASFMPFIKTNSDIPFINTIIKESFTSFIKTHIKAIKNYQNVKCHFIGSVAWHFQKELKEVLSKEKIQIGEILISPLNDLVEYHKRQNIRL